MSCPPTSVKFQLRRALASNWNSSTVLQAGEPGFETDTYKLKIGDGITPWSALPYISGSGGPTGSTGPTGPAYQAPYDIYVAPNGSDGTGSGSASSPYLTISKAITQRNTLSSTTNIDIQLLSGTYNETVVLPDYTALQGQSVQTTRIEVTGATENTTLLTMGENCRVENLTLILGSTTNNVGLTGIHFGGTTTATSKLRTAVLTVDNSTTSSTANSDVYGVLCNGTGGLNSTSFAFNCLKGSTITVKSNGAGIKRGILVNNSNVVTTRDLNVYVPEPSVTGSTGSYVGVETNDPGNSGSILLRSTKIGVVKPTGGSLYTASDILQTTPTSIASPTYLASPGIQIGPGTDLVTKSAGGKGFSTFIYPTTLYYGLKGLLHTGSNGYLWPGTQAIGNNTFPDGSLPPAFYRFQQPAILSGINVHCTTGPTGGNETTLQVYRTIGGTGSFIGVTGYRITFAGGSTDGSYYNTSQDFAAGDLIHVGITYSGGNQNETEDITVQLDVF
jgi:hypothetical protein